MTNAEKQVMYAAFFDELGEIERTTITKEGANFLTAARVLAHSPHQAYGALKGIYEGAGGGLKGLGAVLKTPGGKAVALGAGGLAAGTLAAGAVPGFVAGRLTARRQQQPGVTVVR